MRKLAVLTIAASAALAAPTAEAHVLKKCSTDMSLTQLVACQERNLHHSIGAVKFFKYNVHPLKKWHRKAIEWQTRELQETRQRLIPAGWYRVANCESGGNWYINTGNGFYGGLQFLYSTWHSYGGGRYAEYPHHAAPWQQVAVARGMSLSHWPYCGRFYYG